MIREFFENLFGRQPKKRGYAAAEKKARYSDFKSSRGSADYELRNGLSAVRAKTRYLARNSSSMRRFLSLMKINIVGKNGFMFKSRVRRLNGDLDETLNTRVEEAWADWCEAPTVDGQMSMVHLLSQAVQTWCRDGEVIWEIVRNFAYRDGIAINPLEADYLDETLNTIHPATGNEIRMGVEIDALGKPVAYHFLTYHPGNTHYMFVHSKKQHRRVTADKVIHIFERSRPGQTRGEPHGASVVNSIKMLDGYRESETMRRRLMAAIMGFFSRDTPKPEGISELADDENEDESLFEMDVEPGLLKQMPDGMRFEKFDPGGALTDYAQFESQVKKDISMGFNISSFALGMETEGVSYSTGRSVLVEDRDFYSYMQEFFIDNGLKRVFRLWLSMHILSDQSQIPPTRVEMVRRRCVFRGRGWAWVDPAKEVKANSEALGTFQTSLARVAAERGIDRDDLLDEIEEDKKAAERRGLTLKYSTDSSAQTKSTEDNDDDD
jgi:lambda family phage portal protein